jgi:hypothetical protein
MAKYYRGYKSRSSAVLDRERLFQQLQRKEYYYHHQPPIEAFARAFQKEGLEPRFSFSKRGRSGGRYFDIINPKTGRVDASIKTRAGKVLHWFVD